MTLFFLEAYEHVHKDKTQQYEQMSLDIDNKVKETEPGMLIHAQTKVSENEQEVVYRWLEVFEKYEDMEAHLQSKFVQAHIQGLNDGVVCAPTELVIYCDWDEAQKAPWRESLGEALTFAPLVNAFFR